MKESDVHNQKTVSERVKALELVRGLCGDEAVTAETMLSHADDGRALSEMIRFRPAAKEEIEKHWRDAVRYLLDIAYYDKRKAG